MSIPELPPSGTRTIQVLLSAHHSNRISNAQFNVLDQSVHSTAGNFLGFFDCQHRMGYRQREPNLSYFALVEVKRSESAFGRQLPIVLDGELLLTISPLSPQSRPLDRGHCLRIS